MPKFVLPSIVEQLARGGAIRMLSFTVASWLRYLSGTDDQGREIPLVDPMAAKLRERARSAGADAGALLGMSELFGDVLPRSPAFLDQVSDALRSLYEKGTRATLAEFR